MENRDKPVVILIAGLILVLSGYLIVGFEETKTMYTVHPPYYHLIKVQPYVSLGICIAFLGIALVIIGVVYYKRGFEGGK